jgi:hypothetical protein
LISWKQGIRSFTHKVDLGGTKGSPGGVCRGFHPITLELIRTYVLFYMQVFAKRNLNMEVITMSAESISLIAGTSLSLIFSYIPGAKDWFMQFNPQIKRLILLGLIILSSLSVFGIACLGWGLDWGISLSCDRSGFLGLLEQVIIAIIANQGVYAITPRSKVNCSPAGDDMPQLKEN